MKVRGRRALSPSVTPSTKALMIGLRQIGDARPCFVVAELGVNHNGDAETAKRLIDVAVSCRADAVKFQRRDIQAILTRAAREAPYENERSFGRTYGEHRVALELPDAAWPVLKAHAEEQGLIFFATPYDPGSADFLMALGVPCMKVASCDVTNLPLLRHVAGLGVPIVLSTGGCDKEELDQAVRELWRAKRQDFVLLNCTMAYPAPNEDSRLSLLGTYRRDYACLVGMSGHERGLAISVAAVALGACVIERHLTLDRTMRGPDHAASLEPEGFRRLVRDIRNVEAAMTYRGPKAVLPSERAARDRLRKSLASARAIPKGQAIERADLTVKGPGTGILPRGAESVVGRRALRAIPADVLIERAMVEGLA